MKGTKNHEVDRSDTLPFQLGAHIFAILLSRLRANANALAVRLRGAITRASAEGYEWR